MKKPGLIVKIWIPLVAVGIFILLLLLPYALSPWLVARAERAVAEACPTCQLNVQSIVVSIFRPGHITLHELEVTAGDAKISRLELQVPLVEIDLALWPLRDKNIQLQDVQVHAPRVVFTDADGKSEPSQDKTAEWALMLDHLHVNNGKFSYIRNTHGTSAKLNLRDIELVVDGFATAGPQRDGPVIAQAKLRVENSGEVVLKIETSPFVKPLPIDFDLKAHNQDLADLTPFFQENAGVVLHGILRKGHGTVKVRGTHLVSVVRAVYEKFDVKLLPMYDRSDVSAFFTNLGISIAMTDKNKKAPAKDQTRETELNRAKDESVVHFILTGLKNAALKVTMPELTATKQEEEY